MQPDLMTTRLRCCWGVDPSPPPPTHTHTHPHHPPHTCCGAADPSLTHTPPHPHTPSHILRRCRLWDKIAPRQLTWNGHTVAVAAIPLENLVPAAGSGPAVDCWVEVRVPGVPGADSTVGAGWVPADCVTGVHSDPAAIGAGCTGRVHYVLVAGPNGRLKDVTQRYATDWLTRTKKYRVFS